MSWTRPVLVLAGMTARAIARARAFAIVGLLGAALLPAGASLTLFGFGAKGLLVRESGLATLLLGGLAVVLYAGAYQPGEDLRGGQGLSLLVKPIDPVVHVAGRLAGLGAVLAGATSVWAGVLALVLPAHGGGSFDRGMVVAAALGVLQLVVVAAFLQRVSLSFGSSMTLVAGVAAYFVGHLAGSIASRAEGLGPLAGFAARALPALSGMDFTTAAALEVPIPGDAAALAALYGVLYVGVLVAWTAGSLAPGGAAR